MKVLINNVKQIPITGEYIRLDSFLKYCSLVGTGGEAKIRIQDGEVFVNGAVCTQRGKKLRCGDILRFCGKVYCIVDKVASDESKNADKEYKS